MRYFVRQTIGRIGVLAALLVMLFSTAPAQAANKELVMFGTNSCVYCRLFKREVAGNYRYSRLGHKLPLREVNVSRHGTAGYALRGGPITVTPTFVMFKHGREVARIRGYPGKKNFYRMVRQMIRQVR